MSRNVIGTWELVRTEAADPDGQPLPPPYGGETAMARVVLNADGRMMAVLIDGNPQLPGGTEREYNSYCGAFTFDGKQLITRVDAASDPSRMGTDQVRDVYFEDDLMVLCPPPRAKYGTIEHRRLYWRKLSDT